MQEFTAVSCSGRSGHTQASCCIASSSSSSSQSAPPLAGAAAGSSAAAVSPSTPPATSSCCQIKQHYVSPAATCILFAAGALQGADIEQSVRSDDCRPKLHVEQCKRLGAFFMTQNNAWMITSSAGFPLVSAPYLPGSQHSSLHARLCGNPTCCCCSASALLLCMTLSAPCRISRISICTQPICEWLLQCQLCANQRRLLILRRCADRALLRHVLCMVESNKSV